MMAERLTSDDPREGTIVLMACVNCGSRRDDVILLNRYAASLPAFSLTTEDLCCTE
jgi:hypothetical protein